MGSQATWLGNDLIKVLGDLLTVLIALEVLQNITSYLRRHVVQIELVLVTALTAVARKVIVLPSGAENKPQLLVGLGRGAEHVGRGPALPPGGVVRLHRRECGVDRGAVEAVGGQELAHRLLLRSRPRQASAVYRT